MCVAAPSSLGASLHLVWAHQSGSEKERQHVSDIVFPLLVLSVCGACSRAIKIHNEEEHEPTNNHRNPRTALQQ